DLWHQACRRVRVARKPAARRFARRVGGTAPAGRRRRLDVPRRQGQGKERLTRRGHGFCAPRSAKMRGMLSPAERSHRAKLILCFAAVYFIWGSTYAVASVGVHTLPPILFGGIR